ncbi:MAG: hydrogenase formation protein HypD [Candidatus Omnitrophica bacterium]|nr:hydrogenase formation protein HypD [Candidatus Omnitrophota bacterium]
MKYIDEYRDTKLCLSLAERIRAISKKPLNIMEVCGGHTMSIRKNGIQKMVGKHIKFISGPGCPVCVTAISDIDKAIKLAENKNTVICTFGDLFNVPGSISSLAKERASGADVRVVYSAHDALEFSKIEPSRRFVFLGIGFETTAPTVAASILEAAKENVDNYFVLALNKTMPGALRAVLDDKDSKVNALILPGHVSAITGLGMYSFLKDDLKISGCVSGFEPADMLSAVYILVEAHEAGRVILENAYRRAVKDEGNTKALGIMNEVFEPCHVEWRGIGMIPGSGLKIKNKYEKFDADKNFNVTVTRSKENKACLCGEILRGAKTPADCKLFGKACTPENPMGACMVSSEGTCAAWFRYSE